VLFTDVPSTLKALSKAASLAAGLNANIVLLAPVTAPHPLPTEQRPSTQSHEDRYLRTIAGGTSVPTRINVIYGADWAEAIRSSLEPDAVLVVAWRKRFLFDRTSRLVKQLRREGYNVITVE
jgi:hypothetical protein